MQFYLAHETPHGEEAIKNYGPFDKGLTAALQAKRLTNDGMFGRVTPKRVSDAPDFRPREDARIAACIDLLPPKWDLVPIVDHYARRAGSDGTQIGFFPTLGDAVIGKVKVQNPGRYLAEFYPQIDDLERKRYIAMLDESELLFASTPEDIRMVYENGPDSCMSSTKGVVGDTNRVEAYGAGDLAIAYIRNPQGRISARSICWPARKQYGRLYGDTARLKKALNDLGFQYTEMIVGARLQKLPRCERGGSTGFLTPFFDNFGPLYDRGDHFISGDRRDPNFKNEIISCDGGSLRRWCPKIGDHAEADKFKPVHVGDETILWSPSAVTCYAILCEKTNELYAEEDIVSLANGVRWSKKAFAEHGALCSYSGARYAKEDLARAKNGQTVARRNLREYERLLDDLGAELPTVGPNQRLKRLIAKMKHLEPAGLERAA